MTSFKKVLSGILAAGLLLSAGCSHQTKDPPREVPTVQNDPLPHIDPTGGPVSPHLLQLSNLTAAAEYPSMPRCPKEEDYPAGSQQYYEDLFQWEQERQLYTVAAPEDVRELDPFMRKAMEQFLDGTDNRVCSPLNIYFALAMLAQTTGSTTRQQILNVLEQGSIEDLQEQAQQLWLAHYCDDGATTSLLANSLWLDEMGDFKQDNLDTLARDYYASVFTGDLGTEEMNRQLAAWLDAQTGGLLSEYTKDITLDPASVFCLASTVYFCAGWEDEFYEGNTRQEVFHATDCDITTDFMHQSSMGKSYYEGDHFSAVHLSLNGNHRMWLILPDKDTTPAQLLRQGDYYRLISQPGNWEDRRQLTVNLSVPKFDISGQQNLIPGLKSMGITEVFSTQASDFTPTTDAPVYLGSAQHAARVAVDEEGVIAAAYTMMLACGSAAPLPEKEVDFTLDRPFLFVITGQDNLPVFAGVVEKP